MCNFRKYQMNDKSEMVNWLKIIKDKIGIFKKLLVYESKHRSMK